MFKVWVPEHFMHGLVVQTIPIIHETEAFMSFDNSLIDPECIGLDIWIAGIVCQNEWEQPFVFLLTASSVGGIKECLDECQTDTLIIMTTATDISWKALWSAIQVNLECRNRRAMQHLAKSVKHSVCMCLVHALAFVTVYHHNLKGAKSKSISKCVIRNHGKIAFPTENRKWG